MSRYNPKLDSSQSWFIPDAGNHNPNPWNSYNPMDMSYSMIETADHHNLTLLPPYVAPPFLYTQFSNSQLINAVPFLSYCRQSMPVENCKTFGCIQNAPNHVSNRQDDIFVDSLAQNTFRPSPYSSRRSRSSRRRSSSFRNPGVTQHSYKCKYTNEAKYGQSYPSSILPSEFHLYRSSSNGLHNDLISANDANNACTSNSPNVQSDDLIRRAVTQSCEPIKGSDYPENGESFNVGDDLSTLATTETFDHTTTVEPILNSVGIKESELDEDSVCDSLQSDVVREELKSSPTLIRQYEPSTQATTCLPDPHVQNNRLIPTNSGTTTNSSVSNMGSKDSIHRQYNRQRGSVVSSQNLLCGGIQFNQYTSGFGQQNSPIVVSSNHCFHLGPNGPFVPAGAPLAFTAARTSNVQLAATGALPISPYMYSSALYSEALSFSILQFYKNFQQTREKYKTKVNLRDALHMVVSGVFENAGLFIVGSSLNGFGFDQSDMDMCLTVTSKDMQQKKEAFVVLNQLLPSLRRCSFIRDLNLVRAKVPILKFRDMLARVDCDLNVNNIVCIYNTHLLAMYTRIDQRVRPLGMFIKYWAQRMDIHDGSKGRLSTYPLLLMLIHYLQSYCAPPVLPNLQAKFPKLFNYTQPLSELDMNLELPWDELRSTNGASLAELFIGFIHYYANIFDFTMWAISIRHGAPLPINMAIQRLPPHEQAHTAKSFKVFVEEPFCQNNAARSLCDEHIFSRIRQAFCKTYQVLRSHRPLESIWVNNPTGSSH